MGCTASYHTQYTAEAPQTDWRCHNIPAGYEHGYTVDAKHFHADGKHETNELTKWSFDCVHLSSATHHTYSTYSLYFMFNLNDRHKVKVNQPQCMYKENKTIFIMVSLS